jgi:DNA-binding IscR family transcriptional regulator
LVKAPEEITIGIVWRASEGSIFDVPEIGDEDCPAGLRAAWKSASASLTESADQVTFAQILEASGRDREMYYI